MQWAVTANEAMKASEKSVKDLMASIKTMEKWKVAGLTAYLTENSPMRMLEEVGSFNHLNTTIIVTVSDTGAFRSFERVNGNLTKGMIFPDSGFYSYLTERLSQPIARMVQVLEDPNRRKKRNSLQEGWLLPKGAICEATEY
jgi:hypothetical protein